MFASPDLYICVILSKKDGDTRDLTSLPTLKKFIGRQGGVQQGGVQRMKCNKL